MSTRTRQPRKAASNVTYSDPPEYEGIDSDEDASEEEEEWGGKSTRKGKGKANKQRMSRGGDSSEENDDDAKPARKKRRATKGTRKGKKGKLAMVQALPVELLLEIFSHLGPKELLAVSNTCKPYHALLVAPASSSLWKDARKRYKLPDLEIDNLTELQYAELVFGTHCQLCEKKRVKHADWYLLKRICADCRRTQVVRVDQLKRDRKDLHPLAPECVLRSCTNWSESYAFNHPWGFISDVEAYSAVLWELEGVPDQASTSTPRSAFSPRTGRRSSRSSGSNPSYAELTDNEDEGLAELKSSQAVRDLVAERKEKRATIRTIAKQLCYTAAQAREQASLGQGEEPGKRGWRKWSLSDTRRRECASYCFFDAALALIKLLHDSLKVKVQETDPDFSPSSYVTTKGEALTNDIWERIKPQVFQVVEREKASVLAEEKIEAHRQRQRELRPRYDVLKDTLDESARPFLPLFVDFLLLPSVRLLWEDLDAKLDDAAWDDSLDGILEEVEQHRLDLCLHARACIVAATCDDTDNLPPEHDVDEVDLSDAFFDRTTSFLACTFDGCRDRGRQPFYTQYRGRDIFVGWDYEVCTGVGPLVELLEHQHSAHNLDDRLHYSLSKNAWPTFEFRVHLPPEVACAVSALLEVGKLDPSTADMNDLDGLSKLGWFTWSNAPIKKKEYHNVGSWRKLLHRVKTSARNADRAKIPKSLEPPCVVFHPHSPNTALASIEDSSSDDDSPLLSDSDGDRKPQLDVDSSVLADSDDELHRSKGKGKMRAFSSDEDNADGISGSDGDERGAAMLDSEDEE
ncbi:hypothetical protein JCM10207_001557 [Rhodosporidiobolus poonsookiae]